MHWEGTRTLISTVLALMVSAVLWVGLVTLLRRIATLSPELVMKTVAGTFLLGGSYLVIRACAELDR